MRIASESLKKVMRIASESFPITTAPLNLYPYLLGVIGSRSQLPMDRICSPNLYPNGLQSSPQAVPQRSETEQYTKTEGFEMMPAQIHCKIQEIMKNCLPTSRGSCLKSYKNGNGYIVKNNKSEKLPIFVRQHLA